MCVLHSNPFSHPIGIVIDFTWRFQYFHENSCCLPNVYKPNYAWVCWP